MPTTRLARHWHLRKAERGLTEFQMPGRRIRKDSQDHARMVASVLARLLDLELSHGARTVQPYYLDVFTNAFRLLRGEGELTVIYEL